MYDRILFPTDGSDGASAVLGHVLDIAEQQGATLHILNVADTTHDSVTRIGGEVVDVLEGEGERIVGETADRAAARNVPTVTEVYQGGVPNTIVAYAEKYDIDIIAMPAYGRTGLERLLIGSVTERVIRQASTPVLTLPPDEDSLQYPYRNVLVPTDGSECAAGALDRAVDIVNAVGATLHVLSVVDTAGLGLDIYSETQRDALEEQAQQVVGEAAATARDRSVDSVVERVASGDAVPEAIESYVATNGVDLVVIGTHGRSGVRQHLLGSVTERTVRAVPVPVLTVPGRQSDDSDS